MSYHRSKSSILSSLDNEYIEEGRRAIYKWGETRSTRRKGIRGWAYAFKKRFIDKSILQSFANNLTVSLLIQLILSGLCTYVCQSLDLYIDVHIALFVSPVIFPLAFSINADFQRREHVLEDLALFKGGLIVMFFCHRDWYIPAGLPPEFLKAVTNKLKGLILNVKEYLLTEELMKRSFILQVIYEDFSDISQMNEKMRVALTDGASLIQRVIHYHNLMFWAFERLRVVREYRSPRGIRSFTKVFIFVMPLVLSPYYVFVGKASHNTWGPYYISLISTFVFGTLQGVQDVLDDPFDGISEDDVNLGSLEDWTAYSFLTNRTYTVGRFTVTASIKEKEKTKEPPAMETRNISETRNVSFKKKVNAPLRSILRRASQRTALHDAPDVLSKVSEEDVDVLYPEMALQLHNMKKKQFTGKTTFLPGFQIKENSEDNETDDSSVGGTPVSLHRSSDLADAVLTQRRTYRRNVSFSNDLDDETDESSPERMSQSSLHANDSFPLLPDRHQVEFNHMAEALEPDPDKFSKDLLKSFEKLQYSSGTDRVVQTKPPPKVGIPASLSALFHPLPTQGQNDSPKQPVSSESASLGSTAVTDEHGKNKPSRFTVANSENNASSDSLPTSSSDNSMDEDNMSEPRPSRFSVSPSTQASSAAVSPSRSRFAVTPSTQASSTTVSSSPSRLAVTPSTQASSTTVSSSLSRFAVIPSAQASSTTVSSSPSRFAVTPSTQASATSSGTHSTPARSPSPTDSVKIQLPSKNRFQVKSASSSTLADDKVGERNFALSSSETSFCEDPSSPNNKSNQKPSRFSITKPENQRKSSDDSTTPQEDRTLKNRQSSFWDFSEDDSDDGHLSKTPKRKESRVVDVLDLPDGCSGEVYI